jgi:hypothetical protein
MISFEGVLVISSSGILWGERRSLRYGIYWSWLILARMISMLACWREWLMLFQSVRCDPSVIGGILPLILICTTRGWWNGSWWGGLAGHLGMSTYEGMAVAGVDNVWMRLRHVLRSIPAS